MVTTSNPMERIKDMSTSNFMKPYISAFKKIKDYSSRSSREEFWMFFLYNLLVWLAVAIIGSILGIVNIIAPIYALAVLPAVISLIVRRLHDVGRSGYWTFLLLLPGIGTIIIMIFAVIDSAPGDNAYGPNPKGVSA